MSVKLCPLNPSYDGHLQVIPFLRANDFEGVTRVLYTHVSFGDGGWLYPMRPMIETYCNTHAVLDGMTPIKSPPILFRYAGIGTTLRGYYDTDARTGTYVTLQYFTFLFVPLFPIAAYRVLPGPDATFFRGKVPLTRGQTTHRAIFLVLLTGWGLGALLW